MKTPRKPLTREAREYLESKLQRMKGLEKKKTIKRLEMDDRGFGKSHYKRKEKDNWEVERDDF